MNIFISRILIILFAIISNALFADELKLPATPTLSHRALIVNTFELPLTDIAVINPGVQLDSLENSEQKNYKSRNYPGIGSGIIRVPNTKNEFYMLTDRGPNFDNVNGAGKVYGKIFPIENFAPAIVHVKLENKIIEVINSIPIVDSNGKSVTGISNNKDDETPFDINERVIPYRPGGLDTEAIQLLPDGKTAYAVLQSPMGDPKSAQYSNSRVVRMLRLDCSNPLDIKVTGMFLVLQSNMSDYPATSKQADLKFSDAAMLSDTQILLLERAAKKVKLIVADLKNTTNILDLPISATLEPEEKSELLDTINIKPAETSIAFNSVDVFFDLDTDKLEGMAVLTPSVVALSNDNDFALGENTTNYPSRVWYIKLGKELPIVKKNLFCILNKIK